MHKSTKILLIIFGVVLVVGLIFIVLSATGILAEPATPPPQDTSAPTTIPSQTKSDVIPNDDQSTWKSNQVDSGGKFGMACVTADQINKAAIENGAYTLNINWIINFKSKDDEFIHSTFFYLVNDTDGGTVEQEQVPEASLPKSVFPNLSGTVAIKLKLNTKYHYAMASRIRSRRNTDEGWIWTNQCQAFSSENPAETVGGSTDVKAGYVDTPAGGPDECNQQCIKIQDCPWYDPICKGFCSFGCFLLDMVAGFFNLAFKYLQGAVGIS